MFRKPKSRNIRQRQQNDSLEEAPEAEKPATSGDGSAADALDAPAPKTEVRPSAVSSQNILSFDQEEDDDVVEFKIRRPEINQEEVLLRKHKKIMKKRMKAELAMPNDENGEGKSKDGRERRLSVEIEDSEEVEVLEVKTGRRDVKHDITRIPDESTDGRDKFPQSFTDIPDARAVYEARKKREMLRATGGAVQPVIPVDDTVRADDKYSRNSRLVREDDNDPSDDEDPHSRFITSRTLIVDNEELRRNEQLEALRLEQGDVDEDVLPGGSDDEVQHLSEDEELARWEREQIRKGVSQRRVAELRRENRTHQRHFYDGKSIAEMNVGEEGGEEDMDVEIIDADTRAPLFINADGTLKRNIKYETMAQLIEKISLAASNCRADLDSKEWDLQRNKENAAANRTSIAHMAHANTQIERNFKLFQEMRFYVDNVLNCLNEKILEINDVENAVADLWRTRADDLRRRRGEHRNRRRFERTADQWDSEGEESALPDAFHESMAKFLERAAHLFDDTAPDYADVGAIVRRFVDWHITDPRSFADAFVADCLPKVVGPFVRLELLDWNPLLPSNRPLKEMHWYEQILRLGFNNEGVDPEDPVVVGIIPNVVEKIIIPKLTRLIADQWDPMSMTQTRRLTAQLTTFTLQYPTLNKNSKLFTKLLKTMHDTAHAVLLNEPDIPDHLKSIVAEVRRPKSKKQTDPDDIAALLAQSRSIL